MVKAIDIESASLNVRFYDHTAIIGVFAATKWLGTNNQPEEQTFLGSVDIRIISSRGAKCL